MKGAEISRFIVGFLYSSHVEERNMDTESRFFNSSGLFLCVIISFFCGVFLSRAVMQRTVCQFSHTNDQHELNEIEITDANERFRIFGEDNSLRALALESTSAKFSCNAVGALENLARLHERRVFLEKR